MSDVYVWSTEQFKAMRGKNDLPLDVSDMKAVRELAIRKFGYMMFVFEEVARAFRDTK